jgi:hypothetical protein
MFKSSELNGTKVTQDAKVFASCSSCPSEPGISWLQVRGLKVKGEGLGGGARESKLKT